MDPLAFYNQAVNVRVGVGGSTSSITSLTINGNLRVGTMNATNLSAVTGLVQSTLTVGSILMAGTMSCSSAQVTGTVTTSALAFPGSTSGTIMQLVNNVSTLGSTLAFSGLGITPGTALDYYTLNAHRWWTGSSGTSSGTVGMQLGGGTLTATTTVISGSLTVTGGLISSALAIGGTVSPLFTFTGSTSGTLLQFVNNIAMNSNTLTTTAFSALGITTGTALEYYSLNAHRWWTGSSGTSSGTIGMQLGGGTLTTACGQFGMSLSSQGIPVPKIQYGLGTLGNGSATVTFPTAFVNAPFVFLQGTTTNSTYVFYWYTTSISNTSFSAAANLIQNGTTVNAGSDSFRWVAIGF